MILIILLFFGAASFIYVKAIRKNRLPLPPGPPAEPIIGHLRKMPSQNLENVLYEWGKVYGDVIYLHVLGRPIIVLNSVEAAVDLLDKRSGNYSDRPPFVIYEMLGWVRTLTSLRYGKKFQKIRKMAQDYLSAKRCVTYQPIPVREARILLQNLLSDGTKCDDFSGMFSTSVIIRLMCGHQIKSEDDEFLRIVKDVGHAVENAGPPGNTAVDFFPFLRHFPSWFPGTYYATYARENRIKVDTLHQYPFEYVKKEMDKGTARPSFLSHHLEELNRNGPDGPDAELDIQGTAANIYSAGRDTSSATLAFFFLAMVLHPECQVRAQKELDAVLGGERLPEFTDRDSLPYIDCILQETLRWQSAAPLGIPHCSMEDDVYRGMFIPKGSLIIANTRGMTLDEKIYKRPHNFNPSRYLPKPEGNNEPPPSGPFGFGRRICPGRHFAEASIWIVIASVLSCFDICKAVGEDGKEITPEIAFGPGVTSHPSHFESYVRPRNEQARRLVIEADTWEAY